MAGGGAVVSALHPVKPSSLLVAHSYDAGDYHAGEVFVHEASGRTAPLPATVHSLASASQTAYAGLDDGTVAVLTVNDSHDVDVVSSVKPANHFVSRVACTAESIATGAQNGTVRHFDPRTLTATTNATWGQCPPFIAHNTPCGVPAPIIHVTLSDRHQITAVDARGLIAVYDVRSSSNAGLVTCGRAGFVARARATCACLTNDSSLLWLGTDSGKANAVDMRMPPALGTTLGIVDAGWTHEHRVTALVPYGSAGCISTGEDGHIVADGTTVAMDGVPALRSSCMLPQTTDVVAVGGILRYLAVISLSK